MGLILVNEQGCIDSAISNEFRGPPLLIALNARPLYHLIDTPYYYSSRSCEFGFEV